MKIQEVILRAVGKRITWWQAAEIIVVTDRTMRRWKERYEEQGYDGLYDRRLGKPSPKRVPLKTVEEESTRTVLAAIREVVERKGVFCAMYCDRASHFFVTPKAGGPVDGSRLTQGGRALKELSTGIIPAYSPQARGRRERSFRTWQGRVPQELRVRGIRLLEEANEFLRGQYVGEFNRRFTVPAEQRGSAFGTAPRRDLERIFSIQHERIVKRDNTVQIGNQVLQIDQGKWGQAEQRSSPGSSGLRCVLPGFLATSPSAGRSPPNFPLLR